MSVIHRMVPAWTPLVKVLVDECLSERVADVLVRAKPEHEFEHVRTLGWAGATNGKLLAAAHDAGFEAMITGDLNMEFQTPVPPMPVVVIPTNRSLDDVSRYLVDVGAKLDESPSAGYHRIAPHEGTPEWRKLQLEIRQGRKRGRLSTSPKPRP